MDSFYFWVDLARYAPTKRGLEYAYLHVYQRKLLNFLYGHTLMENSIYPLVFIE